MEKFIIKWNSGFGDSYEVIEATDKDEAIEWTQDLEDSYL